MFFKKLLYTVVLVSLSTVSQADPLISAGQAINAEFKTLAAEAFRDLESLHVDITPDHLKLLKDALAKVNVVAVTGLQEVSAGTQIQNVVAINFPVQNLIKIDANRWLGLGNRTVKKAIAIHEIESLISFEKTGVYELSAKYLKQSGASTDLEAEMHHKLKRLTEFSAEPKMAINECQSHDTLLDVATKSHTSMNLASIVDETFTWLDERKIYALTVFKFTFLQGGIGKFGTLAQMRTLSHYTENPDEVNSQFESFQINMLANGQVFGQYRSSGEILQKTLGENRSQNFTVIEGRPYSNSISTKHTNPDGTVTSGDVQQLYSRPDNIAGRNSTSSSCISTPNPKRSIVEITPRVRKLIRDFTQIHTSAVNAKAALQICQADQIKNDCSESERLYNSLDQRRDQAWASLLLK